MTGAGEVRHNEARHSYEIEAGGATAIAAYRREDGRIYFTHTLVPKELEGRGIGSRLVAGALADVRRAGLKVVPLCPFVQAYIGRHPEEQDLLAEA